MLTDAEQTNEDIHIESSTRKRKRVRTNCATNRSDLKRKPESANPSIQNRRKPDVQKTQTESIKAMGARREPPPRRRKGGVAHEIAMKRWGRT